MKVDKDLTGRAEKKWEIAKYKEWFTFVPDFMASFAQEVRDEAHKAGRDDMALECYGHSSKELEKERQRADNWMAKADTFDWDRQALDRDLKIAVAALEKMSEGIKCKPREGCICHQLIAKEALRSIKEGDKKGGICLLCGFEDGMKDHECARADDSG